MRLHRFRIASASLWTLTTLSLAALGSIACEQTASEVTSKVVKASKDTVKGIKKGIDTGRKEGGSADEAVIVSNYRELLKVGSVTLSPPTAAADAKSSTVDVVIENKGERPLRLTEIKLLGLDGEGFSKAPTKAPSELTIPARSKHKLTVGFPIAASALAKVRVWEHEAAVPKGAASKAPAAKAPPATPADKK